jgi:hypothetical protein
LAVRGRGLGAQTARMSFAMHLVTDRDAGDPVGAEVLARLGTAFPDASVTVTRVARGDTLEAGAWVARLAGGHGAAGSLVAHDVASAPGQPDPWPAGSGEHLCVGRTAVDALVVGANRGWTWSFVVADLRGLCCLDVPIAGGTDLPLRLATALGHAYRRHPHAAAAAVPRSAIPPLPERVWFGAPAKRARNRA